MNIILLGAAGFIGTNLTMELSKDKNNNITVVDRCKAYFAPICRMNCDRISVLESDLTSTADF